METFEIGDRVVYFGGDVTAFYTLTPGATGVVVEDEFGDWEEDYIVPVKFDDPAQAPHIQYLSAFTLGKE